MDLLHIIKSVAIAAGSTVVPEVAIAAGSTLVPEVAIAAGSTVVPDMGPYHLASDGTKRDFFN